MPLTSDGRGRREWWPVAALVAANVALGLFLAPHFGQSTDEAANVKYGEASLQSYLHPLNPYRDPFREDKGPFYLMVWSSASSLIDRAVPGWLPVDARHFVNFLTWQIAVLSVYALGRRFASRQAALMGTLLFATQPLLFGHAFINQKDSPFMAFFAATVALGLTAMDRLADSSGGEAGEAASASLWSDLRETWKAGAARTRRYAVGLGTLAVAVPLARVIADGPLRTWIGEVVRAAYAGLAWGPVQWVFDRVARNVANTALPSYTARAVLVVDVATVVVSLVLTAAALRASGWVWLRLAQRLHAGEVLRLVLPGAIVFGMTVAIRSAGLLAGSLVAGYALARHGRTSVRPVVAYFALAGVVTFLLWPQLWGSPGEWLQSSVERSLRFPEDHEVLFRGAMYDSSALPPEYLPWLMTLQFTLPTVALGLVALGWTGVLCVRRRRREAALWVMMVWFLVPLAAVVVFGVPVYNNFRHLLFMTPPIFIVTSTLWDRIVRWARPAWLAPAMAVVMLAPGVAAIVRLHPYEYIYFNELTGGVRGAFGNYLLDSWCTAYRETMEFVNATAPPGSGIAVWGPISTALPFFRQDLVLVRIPEGSGQVELEAFAAIGCSWATIDPAFFPDARLLWSLEREGVPLAVVKVLHPDGSEP
jgi:hypothetical protein